MNDKLHLLIYFDKLILSKNNQDLIDDITGKLELKYRQLVVGEYYRKYIDFKYPDYKSGYIIKPQIKLEVELWHSVFKMLENMYTRQCISESPAFSIYKLILERELVMFITSSSGGSIRSIDYLSTLTSQNRQLQGYENPFDKQKKSYTGKIINIAISKADTDDEFRKNFYIPMVKARQRFTSFIKNENGKNRSRIYINGKIQRQGRKKNQYK